MGTQAYVTQENEFLGTLTVRETVAYSAQLRLPGREVKGVVEGALEEMGLMDCASRPIGNWHLRGISGGEKKRLAIALEVLTRPPLLFLDEPTSGLDSAAAFFVTLTLRQMTREGRTVVASVHQPSSEVFALFDDLCLLSGGQAVYFGDAKLATEVRARLTSPLLLQTRNFCSFQASFHLLVFWFSMGRMGIILLLLLLDPIGRVYLPHEEFSCTKVENQE